MLALIEGIIQDVVLVRRGSSSAPGCSTRHFPLLVRTADGKELWVYDDEDDGRKIPGDKGPIRCQAPRADARLKY